MPWYRTGTVSVTQNSSTVTGVSTAFAANCRVGDAFRGPDGGWYEVTNIASDTVIAITPNYQGATSSAGTYALAPMQGYVKDSADALRALVNQFGAKLAALGSTGNYDILPLSKGGTGSGDPSTALGNLGLKGGANDLLVKSLGLRGAPVGYNIQGFYTGWNLYGLGETNFICNKGSGTGGFQWWSVNANNTQAGPVMTYSYDGTLSVNSLSVSGSSIDVSSGGTGRSDNKIKFLEAQFTAAPSLYGGTQGLSVGWNTEGLGEANFINNRGAGSGGFTWRSVNSNNTLTGPTMRYNFEGTLAVPLGVTPANDVGANLGTSNLRWATVFASTGTINTSDAREKTEVSKLSENELVAASDLAKEIGLFQYLSAVSEKGNSARHHIGMTVQRAIEILQGNNLNPLDYAFICHDAWGEVPEIQVEEVRGNIYSSDELINADVPISDFDVYKNLPSYTWEETSRRMVVVQEYKPSGDRYGFRTDQLALFIARGQEQRLLRLESLLNP